MIAAVGTVISAIALVGLFIQIYHARQAQSIENKRQRLASTLQFYEENRSVIRLKHSDIMRTYGGKTGDVLTAEKAALLYKNSEDKLKVVDGILARLERLSIGLRYNVYDMEFLETLSGTMMLSMWGYYYRYIQIARSRTPGAYKDYEGIVGRIYENRINEGKSIALRFQTYLSLDDAIHKAMEPRSIE